MGLHVSRRLLGLYSSGRGGFLVLEINFTFARMGIPCGEHSSLAKLRQGLVGQCWPARVARLTNLLPKAQSTANVLT